MLNFYVGTHKMGCFEKFYGFITKWVCCSFMSLTVATRIIASVGIFISIWLVAAFANDTFWSDNYDYEVSRRSALVLGLDWQHLHRNVSRTPTEGKITATVVSLYSVTILGVNLLLLIGTLRKDWRFSVPWLLVEILSIVSKIGSSVFHWECTEIKWTFFFGSFIYIIVYIWWWFVVFATQLLWRNKEGYCVKTEFYPLENSTRIDSPSKVNSN